MSGSPDGVTWTSPSTVSTIQLPLGIVSFRGRYLAFLGFGSCGCPVTCDPGWAEVLASTDLEIWQSVWDSTYPFVQPQKPPTMPVFVESHGMSSIQSVGRNQRLQIAVGANGTLLRRECEPEPMVPHRRLGRSSGASQP